MTQAEKLNTLARLDKQMKKYLTQAEKFEDTRELLVKFGKEHGYWHLPIKITALKRDLGV